MTVIRVYLAHAITGRSGKELVEESDTAKRMLNKYSITVIDPVMEEGISEHIKAVNALPLALKEHWKRDKLLIQKADVLLDLTGPAKSEGVAHEIGYARYCLWIPVVRIWPGLSHSIARLEDDCIVGSTEEAAIMIQEYWGTYYKRLEWRVKMLSRCLGKWLLLQTRRLFQ